MRSRRSRFVLRHKGQWRSAGLQGAATGTSGGRSGHAAADLIRLCSMPMAKVSRRTSGGGPLYALGRAGSDRSSIQPGVMSPKGKASTGLQEAARWYSMSAERAIGMQDSIWTYKPPVEVFLRTSSKATMWFSIAAAGDQDSVAAIRQLASK